MGEKIEGHKIFYQNEEDNIKCNLGIFGVSIKENTAIDSSELELKGNKIKLQLIA